MAVVPEQALAVLVDRALECDRFGVDIGVSFLLFVAGLSFLRAAAIYEYVNEAFVDLVGYSREEMIGSQRGKSRTHRGTVGVAAIYERVIDMDLDAVKRNDGLNRTAGSTLF